MSAPSPFGLPAVPLQSADLSIGLAALLLLGLAVVYLGFRKYRIGRLIEDTPTEKCRSVAVGRTQLEGTAVPDDEVASAPFTGEDCVAASYEIEERRETDDGTDWVTLEVGTVTVPFHIEDDTGRVLVEADEADIEVDDDHVTERVVGGGSSTPEEIATFLEDGPAVGERTTFTRDQLTSSIGLSTSLSGLLSNVVESGMGSLGGVDAHTSDERRYTEAVVSPGADLYAFGATEPHDGDGIANEERVKLTEDAMTGTFILANEPKDDIASGYKRAAPLWMGGGLLLSAVALYALVRTLGV